MHKIVFLLSLVFYFSLDACSGTKESTNSNGEKELAIVEENSTSQPAKIVIPGAYRLEEYLSLLADKKVGLMVNQTSMIGNTHLVDTLLSIGVDIQRIFAPEHGFRGDHSAGAHVRNSTDVKTGLQITSLYGKHRKPTNEMMSGLDIVIFDIQDVGVRFYTYISSMHYLMEACSDNSIAFMVLDRPNPNGHFIDGPTLEPEFRSFIGMHEVPLVHGMTTGEFAKMIQGRGWLKSSKELELMVVHCENYDHNTFYQLPVRPSPNLPNMSSVYLYPSLGLFEGTNVSVGRGTEKPFQILGRPGQKNTEINFTPESIPGVSDHPKYEGKTCGGMDLEKFVLEQVKDSGRLFLQFLFEFNSSNNIAQNGAFFKPFFSKLAGTKRLQEQIENGVSEYDIRKTWKEDIDSFREMRREYLLYSE
mgnify:CR=1 FL=1